MQLHDFVATCALALEDLVAAELQSFGATDLDVGRAVVRGRGSLEVVYRSCLWSRVASRIVLPVATFAAPSTEALYAGVHAIPWGDHLGPDDTLAVDFTEHGSAISHTQFGAQKVKDGIVDRLRDQFGRRPDVDRIAPKLRVNVRLEGEQATVAIDCSGASLHRRGYRLEAVQAPMRETLAAAMLLRSRWPAAALAQQPLVDPMCGSGTLLIEAALMALDHAPGLGRPRFGFEGWRGHDAAVWQCLRQEAERRQHDGHYEGVIAGSDIDPEAIRIARGNALRAGVGDLVRFDVGPLSQAAPPPGPEVAGLVIVNPPYGERLDEPDGLAPLYAELGQTLKSRFAGWTAHVLTSSPTLASALGLTPKRVNSLWNGALPCQLMHCEVHAKRTEGRRHEGGAGDQLDTGGAGGRGEGSGGDGAKTARFRAAPVVPIDEALANRLQKNLRRLTRWAAREKVSCYRLYDADLPEYAAAIDRYEDYVSVQEYAAPAHVDEQRARERMATLTETVRQVLQLPAGHLAVKTRRRQKPGARYEKIDTLGALREVHEGGHKFLVNLTDYLDTGLFLDSRLIRRMVGELAPGRHFLNLFSYTGTATVYAAAARAASTTSVDLSKTYLSWAERNLERNGIRGAAHALIRADCRVWLDENRDRYGLILLDPPTFSSSKRMDGTLDIQRDHGELINAAARLLDNDGILLFCTNFRRFKLDPASLDGLTATDLTPVTMPLDFSKSPRIHRCWRLARS